MFTCLALGRGGMDTAPPVLAISSSFPMCLYAEAGPERRRGEVRLEVITHAVSLFRLLAGCGARRAERRVGIVPF